jgi:hypothetical protein
MTGALPGFVKEAGHIVFDGEWLGENVADIPGYNHQKTISFFREVAYRWERYATTHPDRVNIDYDFSSGVLLCYAEILEKAMTDTDASPEVKGEAEAVVPERMTGWLGKLRSRLSRAGAETGASQ